MWIVRLALRRPYTFVVMALAILLLGIVAIVKAMGALNGMKATGDMRGKGVATAALIIGIIDIPLGIVASIMTLGMQRGHY